jgi:hypothetical protein
VQQLYKPILTALVLVLGGFLFLEVLLVGMATWPLFLEGTLATRVCFIASLVAFGGQIVCLLKQRFVAAVVLLAAQGMSLFLANTL